MKNTQYAHYGIRVIVTPGGTPDTGICTCSSASSPSLSYI